MDVTLRASVDGGPPQTGAILLSYAAGFGKVVQLSAANKSEWGSNAAVRWELFDYPPGYALPAGWTNTNDDDVRPTYVFLGMADPPPFTMSDWGPYKTRLVVPGAPADERTFLKVTSQNGLEPFARGETYQFWGMKLQWLGVIQAAIHKLDNALAGLNVGTNYIPIGVSTIPDLASGTNINIGAADNTKCTANMLIDDPINIPAVRTLISVHVVGDGAHAPTWGSKWHFGTGGAPNEDPASLGNLTDGKHYEYLFQVVSANKIACLMVTATIGAA